MKLLDTETHGSVLTADRLQSVWRIACHVVVLFAPCVLGGCLTPHEKLTFPTECLSQSNDARWYDVNRNGRSDFGLMIDAHGRLDSLAYDDDEDGEPDCVYPRNAPSTSSPRPHLIVMLDSIPFHAVEERFAAGEWPWFGPPRKVIPPFPTMSGLIFTAITHAPPLPGMINRYYDREKGKTDNRIVSRAMGHENPWHQRLHYRAKYWQNGLAFLKPRHWYAAELVRLKEAFDECPDRACVVYVASSSGMLSRYGEAGMNESLDGLTQLCLQLLYERQGDVDISVLADHGHNLTPGKRIDLEQTLREAGFKPAKRLKKPGDVVIENDGMVNYIGLHTNDPAGVATALIAREEIQLAMYVEGDGVVVRDAQGSAIIEHRDGRFRYRMLDRDVLGYEFDMQAMQSEGKISAEGFVSADDWFNATIDREFPDGPPRIWNAFHGLVQNTPDVMLTVRDGWCTGLGFLELFITMQSTHGGIDQTHSATFVMTTTGRANSAMRSDEVLEVLGPGIIEQLAAHAEAAAKAQ